MFKILILIIALLGITQGSALTIEELTAQHSEDTIRQTKSEDIQRYMNLSVNPCEDFYEFTCGNFAKYHPEALRLNLFDTLQKQMTRKLANLLEKEDVGDTDVDRKVKNFYKSCMKIPANPRAFGDKLQQVIAEFGRMPVLEGDQWQEDSFDWMNILAQMIYKSDVNILFNIGVMSDFDDDTVERVNIGEPSLLMAEWSFYVDESFRNRRESHVIYIAGNLALIFGVEPQLAVKTATEIKDFEVAIAQAMRAEKLRLTQKELYTLSDIDQTQAKFGQLCDIKKILNNALGSVPHELYVDNQYVEAVLNVLKNTPKRVVVNYIFYSYLNLFIPAISKNKTIMESNCLNAARKQFNKKLDNMIYRKYLTAQMEEDVYRMWREMKRTFRNILQSARLQWIREETRAEALIKLKNMKLVINSNEKINFTEEFQDLDLNDDYVHNIKSILMTQGNQAGEEMEKSPQNEDDEEESPQNDIMEEDSFSPLYFSLDNTVYLTIGSLQPYYLWATPFPYAYNFASFGSVVGHEIVHGFDDGGRQYDSNCNERDWWDTDSDKGFRERTKCFVNQYKQYVYGGKPLPESSQQRENIADNGGLRLAYEAYLNWYANAGRTNQNLDSESFPGLNFTAKQLFFISYGHTYCAAVHPDYMAVQLATDSHTPEKFRVIGSLSNYDEFSKAFNCPKGAAMNPINKCVIY